MGFLTEAGRRELKAAVGAIEAASSIEVVVAVRSRLRRWPSANAAIGVVCALAALAFQLYSEDFDYDYWTFLVLPVVAGLVGGVLVEFLPSLQRALTPRRIRRENLLEAARATFYELGVHKTAGRTGLLVFVAIRDRAVTLVGDVTVIDKIGQRKLDGHASTIATAIPAGAEAVARKLRDVASALAKALPRKTDDVDELANEIHEGRRWPRRYLR